VLGSRTPRFLFLPRFTSGRNFPGQPPTSSFQRAASFKAARLYHDDAVESTRDSSPRLKPGAFSLGSVIGLLTLFIILLSRGAADRIFKMFGTSRSGTVVEIWGRSAPFSDSESDSETDVGTVEVPLAEKENTGGALFLLFFIINFTSYIIIKIYGGPRFYSLIILIAPLSGFALFKLWRGNQFPHAWADGRGVTGYPTGVRVGRKFVPWSEVETCEIETIHDTFGTPILIRPVFKDQDGRKLMTLDLIHTRFEDQERLAAYIRTRLPQPRENLDAW
jgi:hypothetical protein